MKCAVDLNNTSHMHNPRRTALDILIDVKMRTKFKNE